MKTALVAKITFLQLYHIVIKCWETISSKMDPSFLFIIAESSAHVHLIQIIIWFLTEIELFASVIDYSWYFIILKREPRIFFQRLSNCLPLPISNFGSTVTPTVLTGSTGVLPCDPKLNLGLLLCKLVISCTKTTLTSYACMLYHTLYNTFSVLCFPKHMRPNWHAYCRWTICVQRTTRTNRTPVYDFPESETFAAVLHKFDCLMKHLLREDMRQAPEVPKSRYFRIFPNFFFCFRDIANSSSLCIAKTYRRSIPVLWRYGEIYTFPNSYEVLESAVFLARPIQVQNLNSRNTISLKSL